jgi:hypothetical protein
VFRRGSYESQFPFDCGLDLSAGYFVLLCKAVRNNGHVSAVEKVKHSVVDAPETASQLINIIAQVIRFWPAQLVSYRSQTGQAHTAFRKRSRVFTSQLGQPLNHRGCAVSFPEENEPGDRHFQLRLKLSQTHDSVKPFSESNK